MIQLSVKSYISVLINEVCDLFLQSVRLIAGSPYSWADHCNRNEQINVSSDGIGRNCAWTDSSTLTSTAVFPWLAKLLLIQAWRAGNNLTSESQVSVIIPFRGQARVHSLHKTVQYFLKQLPRYSDIIIVEHSPQCLTTSFNLPRVTCIHVPCSPHEEFNKSKCFNVGACHSANEYLCLHDVDILPSPAYIKASLSILDRGYAAVRPLRFIFNLDQSCSPSCDSYLLGLQALLRLRFQSVQQNFPGASTFIGRESYIALGGHDEAFQGWGGEDLEFLSRLKTLNLYPGSFLPCFHLWHPEAPKKASGDRNNKLQQARLNQTVSERIKVLHDDYVFRYKT